MSFGRFHDILPREYSGTFPELLGDYKKRCLLTTEVSQILSLTRLIVEIKSNAKRIFHYNHNEFIGRFINTN